MTERHDTSCGASPSILAPLRQALAAAAAAVDAGRVDGGTGNYAAALPADGFAPVVIDI